MRIWTQTTENIKKLKTSSSSSHTFNPQTYKHTLAFRNLRGLSLDLMIFIPYTPYILSLHLNTNFLHIKRKKKTHLAWFTNCFPHRDQNMSLQCQRFLVLLSLWGHLVLTTQVLLRSHIHKSSISSLKASAKCIKKQITFHDQKKKNCTAN